MEILILRTSYINTGTIFFSFQEQRVIKDVEKKGIYDCLSDEINRKRIQGEY